MAIEGPLRELGIEDVLQLLELARKTGVLRVRSERQADEAELHFDGGALVFAQRRRSMRRLGQQLLRAGKLTERELRHALELQKGKEPRQRLGQVLLEMGSVTEDELRRQLQFQLEETIYDVMGWEEGHFRFVEQQEVPSDSAVRVRVESLLMEGARRIDEWSRLEPRIPSLEAVPALAPHEEVDGDAAPLELRPDEWEVLAEIDGERDLRQIAADLGRSNFDVAKTVYGLVSMGVVLVNDSPRRGDEAELEGQLGQVRELLQIGDWESAARRAAELEAAYPEHGEVALLAGDALAGQGRTRAATEAYARAVGLDPLSTDANHALGFSALRIGELERAARALEAFLRLAQAGSRTERARRALGAVTTLHEILAEEQSNSDEIPRASRLAALE